MFINNIALHSTEDINTYSILSALCWNITGQIFLMTIWKA